MNLRTITSATSVSGRSRGVGLPVTGRRPGLYLATAAAGAVVIAVVTAGEPAAQADAAQPESVSVAAQLGISTQASPSLPADAVGSLEQLAASRSERDAERTAAAAAQDAADRAELDRIAAEQAAEKAAAEKAAAEKAAAEKAAAEKAAAEKAAAEEAARAAAARAAQAEAAAARPGRGTSAGTAPAGSYKDYALSKVGSGQFSCLVNLWGKESGWNPNAQNPSSTAYGIAQFLDSTWAGTGIAKTSDGYRQIDAGLIYIRKAYGSPCGAWAKSRSSGWY